ncbi:G-type lectin S-receptor-like serine/threonine-protein kinase SD1-1 [Jatropha curcas]|uniref:G-type lectin S-receptor-like serine/threonine-protein kinase SD1-1 n=1 Tax=Jatropha curcas TaxID=180498 RepID=UPI001894373A|nr:G-type lectin S-receptor-like serine/threonine-protein kinase SD1-1 [Jatropha curcas]
MNLNECRAKCLQNCSCTAYSSYDIRNGGNGCIIWLNDLTDIREIPVNGQDLYIRMSASELVGLEDVGGNQNKKMLVMIIIPSVIATSGILAVSYYYFKSGKKLKENNKIQDKNQESDEELELPLFDFTGAAII